MTASSILVTGAAGFAGRHVLAHVRASAAGHQVLAWSRRPHDDDRQVHWRQVDITDTHAVHQAITDAQPARILHLAGSPHVGQSWRNSLLPLQTNVLGTHHLLEAVRLHSPDSRVVVVTSAMIYQASTAPLTEDAPLVPSSPYGLSKLAQDQLALAAAHDDGLQVVVARPFNHIGPGQDPTFAISSFARQIALIEAGLAPAVLQVGNLDAERDLTDVRDVVDAYVRLLDHGRAGRPYNICTGTAHRIGDLLDHLIALARVPVTRTVDPERLRPSDMPRLVGDSTRIRAELGWAPQRPLQQTLADTLEWWRAAVAAGRVTA
ncbi:MAG: GDP-mannose 4,6-dehydratase [Acidobacteria bacterium]|nr:GDP-mannose 4,6-dehydratase [Acidobacteriota bacterium]